jgi:hypothetical protein
VPGGALAGGVGRGLVRILVAVHVIDCAPGTTGQRWERPMKPLKVVDLCDAWDAGSCGPISARQNASVRFGRQPCALSDLPASSPPYPWSSRPPRAATGQSSGAMALSQTSTSAHPRTSAITPTDCRRQLRQSPSCPAVQP